MTIPNHGPAGRAVAALRKADKIGDPEFLAAERWYRDYALGVEGVFDSDMPGSGDGDAHTAGFARAKAHMAYLAAARAVGNHATFILTGIVISGLTFGALGRQLGVHNSEATGCAISALRRLAEHYAEMQPAGSGEQTRTAEFSACKVTK